MLRLHRIVYYDQDIKKKNENQLNNVYVKPNNSH